MSGLRIAARGDDSRGLFLILIYYDGIIAAFWIGFAAINTVLRYARNDGHCEERSDEAIQKPILS
jgi:hypothetical protein